MMAMALIIPMMSNSYALQEVASKINLSLKPGDQTAFNWGIVSDSSDIITVQLKAVGDGSQFLSYPRQVTLSPQKIVYVVVNASIPTNYYGKSTFTPFLIATQAGQQGGSTVLNIQVQKLVTLHIVGAPSTPPTGISSAQSGSTVPEFPSIAGIIFAVSIMSVLGLAVLSKRGFGNFKI